MAAAVQELYPGTKFGIGPSVENGFYYDFKLPRSIAPEDLYKIEKKTKELVGRGIAFKKRLMSKSSLLKLFKNQPYKLELIKEAKEKRLSVYQSDKFIDLCRGPHVKSGKEINPEAFKLTGIAGAYWRGNEKNTMLTRIYGVAFKTEKELAAFLKIQKEAEKRNHRMLGKKLDLFCFSELVGPGFPLLTPKGTIVKEELQKRVEEICRNYGFQKVFTPHLAKIELYKLSGHADKFNEELFRVSSPRKHNFVIRPVLCPHHAQIYASKIRSYRNLPIRYMESERMYRAEKPGEVGGLNRVYAITVEDGHSFCTIEQVKNEVKIIVNIIKDFYGSFGLWGNHWVSLSVRDRRHPEKYIGEKRDWDLCEKILKEVSDEMKLNAERKEGEAALYGPKLDFMFKDAFGKGLQIPTVQIDFATPKRFNLTYIDKKGKEKNPVMVHRAILGSYERFMALILEYYAGALPFWLAPEQVWVIPIGSRHEKYAGEVGEKLKNSGLRIQVKNENETVAKKIREGELQKIPYLLVVGDKEIKQKSVSVRERNKGDVSMMKLVKFVEKIKNA